MSCLSYLSSRSIFEAFKMTVDGVYEDQVGIQVARAFDVPCSS